jgi:hypothetical protein
MLAMFIPPYERQFVYYLTWKVQELKNVLCNLKWVGGGGGGVLIGRIVGSRKKSFVLPAILKGYH